MEGTKQINNMIKQKILPRFNLLQQDFLENIAGEGIPNMRSHESTALLNFLLVISFWVLKVWSLLQRSQKFIISWNFGLFHQLFSSFFPPVHCFSSLLFVQALLFQISHSQVHNEWIERLISLFMLYEKWNIFLDCFHRLFVTFAVLGPHHCFCLLIQMESVSNSCKKFFLKCFSDFQEFSFSVL